MDMVFKKFCLLMAALFVFGGINKTDLPKQRDISLDAIMQSIEVKFDGMMSTKDVQLIRKNLNDIYMGKLYANNFLDYENYSRKNLWNSDSLNFDAIYKRGKTNCVGAVISLVESEIGKKYGNTAARITFGNGKTHLIYLFKTDDGEIGTGGINEIDWNIPKSCFYLNQQKPQPITKEDTGKIEEILKKTISRMGGNVPFKYELIEIKK